MDDKLRQYFFNTVYIADSKASAAATARFLVSTPGAADELELFLLKRDDGAVQARYFASGVPELLAGAAFLCECVDQQFHDKLPERLGFDIAAKLAFRDSKRYVAIMLNDAAKKIQQHES